MSELFLARELFRIHPFAASDEARFYMQYRPGPGYKPESCLAGPGPPQAAKDNGPGIYYRDREEQWRHCAWYEGVSGAGISVVVEYPRQNATVVVLFGFSGRCTELLGRCFLDRQRAVW